MHVPKAETSGSVRAESEYLTVTGHDQRLVAEIAEDAGQPDLGSELLVQETEDCPAAQVHPQSQAMGHWELITLTKTN